MERSQAADAVETNSANCDDDATDLSLANMEVLIAIVDDVVLWSACPNET